MPEIDEPMRVAARHLRFAEHAAKLRYEDRAGARQL